MTISRGNRKRFIRKEVCFTPEELAQVQRSMSQMGTKNFQYYAKNQLVQGRLVQIDFPVLKQLRVEINRIGNNINQIAKHANENDQISAGELEQVLEELKEIRRIVNGKITMEERNSILEKSQIVRTYD